MANAVGAPDGPTGEPMAPPHQRRSWWRSASGITAASAVVATVVAAVPVAIQLSQIDGATSGPTAAVTTPATTPRVEFKSVSHETAALVVDVPTDWEVQMSRGFSEREKLSGIGMNATADLSDLYSWRTAQLFIGASRDLARVFVESDKSTPADALVKYARSFDWTLDQCRFEREVPFSRGTYAGVYRVWSNCAQAGSALWELTVLTHSQAVALVLQLRIPTGMDASQIAMRALDTFELREEKMPSSNG